MNLKDVVFEDYINYKKPSMFLIFPKCSFKCDSEFGVQICQNWEVAHLPDIDVDANKLIRLYLQNPLTKAVVCGGLEPFDSSIELSTFINNFRTHSNDDIVIYTGYTEEELQNRSVFKEIISHKNIIIKFGRYIPDYDPHYDEVLGVELNSDNQYAKGYNLCE